MFTKNFGIFSFWFNAIKFFFLLKKSLFIVRFWPIPSFNLYQVYNLFKIFSTWSIPLRAEVYGLAIMLRMMDSVVQTTLLNKIILIG